MQFLPFEAKKQQLDGTTKVIRFAQIGVYVAGSSYATLATGVINGATGLAENPITAGYNGQASIGADGTFDVKIVDPDGGDPIEYRNITWTDIAQKSAEAVSAANTASAALAGTAANALRAEAAADEATSATDIKASVAQGLTETAPGQFFAKLSDNPDVDLERYEHLAGGTAALRKETVSKSGVDTKVKKVASDVGAADLRNLLTEDEATFADLSCIRHEADQTISRQIVNGRVALVSTRGAANVNFVEFDYLPVSLFRATGKLSIAIEVIEADATATSESGRFLHIRQLGATGASSLKTDSVTLPVDAIVNKFFTLPDVTLHADAKRIAIRFRRNAANFKIGRIVATADVTATERPLSTARSIQEASHRKGFRQRFLDMPRQKLDFAPASSTNLTPLLDATADGVLMGAYTSNSSGLNPYLMQTDAVFVENMVSEFSFTSRKADTRGDWVLVAIGPAGAGNLDRTIYGWRSSGLVRQFPGSFVGSTDLAVADSSRARAIDNVVTFRIRRNVDGSGVIGITPASGVEQTFAISAIPVGPVWVGTRNDTSAVYLPAEFRTMEFQVAAAIGAGGVAESRVAKLEKLLGITAPVLKGYKILPEGVNAPDTGGFTGTGLSEITEGRFAGCFLVGCDGRREEGDGSDYMPRVYVVDPEFDRILKTFVMPYTEASVQGVAFRKSSRTFGVSTAGDRKIRHFNLYGENAGQEIEADQFDWTSLGLSHSNTYNNPNGLAYHEALDAWLVGVARGTTVRAISVTSLTDRLLASYTVVDDQPDQFHFRSDKGHLYYTVGSNGSDGYLRRLTLSTGVDQQVTPGLKYAQAIEGVHINFDTGEALILSDARYHDTNANPALNIVLRYALFLID